MRKAVLLIISLVSIGCVQLPPFPEIEQDGYSYKYKKFRACNTITHKCRNISLDSPSMEGAQCMSGPDYKKSEQWVDAVVEIANQRCK